MRSRTFLLGSTLLALAVVPACGQDSEPEATACRKVSGPDIALVAEAMAFDAECLEVAPGTYTFSLENRDRIPHNLRVTGQGINEATELVAGPNVQEIVVDLTTPGRYPFACDPHAQMEGVIVVTDPADATSSTTG